jgi:hypothetical protein
MKTIIHTLIFQFFCALNILNAQTTVFSENFTGFARTDVTVNNRSKVLKTDGITTLPGWIICSGARQEAGALKLGQGSTVGYVTTPKLNLSTGSISVSINAAVYAKPLASPGAAPIKVAVLVDGAKVGEFSVGQAWRDVNHSDPFNNYSLADIPAASANSKVTIEVGNTTNGGTAGNSVILDQVQVTVNGTSVLLETFDNFTLGYSWTWNQTWDGASNYTNNSPTDLFPFIIGELSTELNSRTQQSGWKGKAIFEKGGMAVIGWERKYNSATTEPDYPGYLTTPNISYQTGDVLTYIVGTNVGLVGTPSSPTMQVLLGDINSSTVISTPTLSSATATSAATTYTYTFTDAGTNPITFKLGTTTSTKDEAFLSLVKVERSINTSINEKNKNKIIVTTKGNQLIINNYDVQDDVFIYSYSGMLIKKLRIVNGYNQFNLNQGIYIIKMVNGHSFKVII